MKEAVYILLLCILSQPLFAGSSREYQPVSELERQHYRRIDKGVWPDDVRSDIFDYA
jgi:hypothetical protein